MTSTAPSSPQVLGDIVADASSSHTAQASRCCIPSGVGSPAWRAAAVMAADRSTLRTKGRDCPLERPEIIPPAQALAAYPPLLRRIMRSQKDPGLRVGAPCRAVGPAGQRRQTSGGGLVPRSSCGSSRWPAPLAPALATHAGALAALGGQDVGVAGVGVAPAQVALELGGRSCPAVQRCLRRFRLSGGAGRRFLAGKLTSRRGT
jgi:hypothetical protein